MLNLKKYYKAVVAGVGAVLVLLAQLTPLASLLPGNDQHWFTVIVSVVTAVSVFLVKNEPLVEGVTPPAA